MWKKWSVLLIISSLLTDSTYPLPREVPSFPEITVSLLTLRLSSITCGEEMKKIFSFVCLAALVGALGCAPANSPAPVTPAESEQPAADASAAQPSAEEAIPAGRFVQANPKLATLRAKFVYGGKAPARAKVDSSKDPFCAPLEIYSDAMLVGTGGELQNLVMMLDKSSKDKVPAEFLKPAEGTLQLDNNGCVFKPHILFARVGQDIEVLNSDQTGHNANFTYFKNESENFLIPAGGKKKSKKLVSEESTLMPVECNIHPWMKAWIIVQEHPYVGISDEAGVIEIQNLPLGELTFLVRHENSDGAIDGATVNGKEQKWSRGKMDVELKAGMNDLGTITIAADKFRN
jgi:plastocyanin